MAENEVTCKKCGESVSGPDKASVQATMKRHTCSPKKVKK